MNWAAPHLASKKKLHICCRKEKFFKGREGAEKNKIISKECIILGKVPILRGRSLLLDYLQEISGLLVTGHNYNWKVETVIRFDTNFGLLP